MRDYLASHQPLSEKPAPHTPEDSPSRLSHRTFHPSGVPPSYGDLLSEAGFSRRPGAWTLREEAPVILAAHLDTVAGRVPKGVRVVDGVAQGVEGALGADDKAGVALVLALAQDPPPGVGFALFLGEEVGCVGSEEALEAGLFRGARAVVSLDRRGKEEVIRAQLGQETASLEAASWLARRLGLPTVARSLSKPSIELLWPMSCVRRMGEEEGNHGA